MLSHKTLIVLGAALLVCAPGAYAASGGSVYEEREIYAERERAKRARTVQREVGITPENQFYIGADIGQFGSGSYGTVLFGQVGTEINDMVSMELRAGVSPGGMSAASDAERVVDRELDEVSANSDAYLDLFWGIYARNNLSRLMGDASDTGFEPYFMIGFTHATISAENNETAEDGTAAGTTLDTVGVWTPSFGLGATFGDNNGFSFDIELMRYVNKSGFSVTSFSFGVNWMLNSSGQGSKR